MRSADPATDAELEVVPRWVLLSIGLGLTALTGALLILALVSIAVAALIMVNQDDGRLG